MKPALFDAGELDPVAEAIRAVTRSALASSDFSKIIRAAAEEMVVRAWCRRIHDPYEQHEAFRALATSPRFWTASSAAIGPHFGLQHQQSWTLKPARVGSVVQWPQDLRLLPSHQHRPGDGPDLSE